MIDRYRVRLLIGGAVSLPLFFLPFTPEDPFLVPKQALLSFLACFALIILLYPVETLLRDSSRALLLSSLFLLVCIAISIPGSSNKYAGLTELIRWSYLLIIFFTAIRIDWGLRRLRNFMKMTILISALVAISALLEYFRLVPFYLYPFRGGRTLYSFFGYPNIMAQYLIVTIFWGIAILVSSETKKIRAIALICTMLSVSALLVTFSRGAIISTIMSGLFFSFLYLKIKSNVNVSAKKIIFIVGFLIIACTTSILLSDSASDGKTLIQIKDMFKRGDSYRIMLWSKSFNAFSLNPITVQDWVITGSLGTSMHTMRSYS
jgi:hypothetical protein